MIKLARVPQRKSAMNKLASIPLLFSMLFVVNASAQTTNSTPPALLLGNFIDDYNISYIISPERFQLGSNSIYNILEWNNAQQFIIAQADSINKTDNKTDALKWVRIDWMEFADMAPYKWGFCLTTWTAATASEARQTKPANRQSPRDGCGGYPFSRMKPATR